MGGTLVRVPLQTQGAGPSLFVIHALGGRVIGYNELVKHRNRVQPLNYVR
jgi:hypothetical protein